MHVLYGGPSGATYALYGAREPLLQAPLHFADDTALHVFIEPYFQTPASIEVFRHALIAQGIWALPDHTRIACSSQACTANWRAACCARSCQRIAGCQDRARPRGALRQTLGSAPQQSPARTAAA